MQPRKRKWLASTLVCTLAFAQMPCTEYPIQAMKYQAEGQETEAIAAQKVVLSSTYGSADISGLQTNYYGTFQLKARLTPSNSTEKLTFSSSDESVLLVTQEGTVIPVSPGKAIVTVTTASGKTDTCDITIFDNSTYTTTELPLYSSSRTKSRAVAITGFFGEKERSDMHLPKTLYGCCQVAAIAEGAFAEEAALKTVVLQKELEQIGKKAFADCKNLEIVTIQNDKAEIAEDAFENDKIILKGYAGSTAEEYAKTHKDITFQEIDAKKDNLTTSPERLFLVSNQKALNEEDVVQRENSVYLGVNAALQIDSYAFLFNQTKAEMTYTSADEAIATISATGKLVGKKQGVTTITATTANGIQKSFEVRVVEDFTLGEQQFSYNATGELVFVSNQKASDALKYKNTYIAGANTSARVPKIDIVGEEAFAEDTKASAIYISDGVSKIEKRAFANCTNVDTIYIPDSVTEIDDTAFGDYENGDRAYNVSIVAKKDSPAERFAKQYDNIQFIDCSTGEVSYSIIKKKNDKSTAAPVVTSEPVITTTPSSVTNKPTENGKKLLQTNWIGLACFSAFQIPVQKDVSVKDCSFTSSDESVAIVTKDGTVIGVSNGIADITVTTKDGKTESCRFAVVNNESVSYELKEQDKTSNITGLVPFSNTQNPYKPSTLRIAATANEGYTVLEITKGAFANIDCLEHVVLPASLKKISAEAFANCSNLKTVIIPGKTTVIDETAFAKDTITIKGYKGSTAEAYAKEHENITFQEIDAAVDNITAAEEAIYFVQKDGGRIVKGLELQKGRTLQLSIGVCSPFYKNADVKFTNSNTDVVEWKEDGTLNAKSEGEATLTAVLPNGVSKTLVVRVNLGILPMTTPQVSKSPTHTEAPKMTEAPVLTEAPTLEPEVTKAPVLTETIVPEVSEKPISTTEPVKTSVIPKTKKTKIKLTAKKATIKVGKTFTFKATKTNTNKKLTWSVSNKKIAVIQKKTGKLTAKKAGKVTVTATCNGVKKSFQVKIK